MGYSYSLHIYIYYIYIYGVCWGYNPLILTFGPNFLGHPSTPQLAPFIASTEGHSKNHLLVSPMGPLEGISGKQLKMNKTNQSSNSSLVIILWKKRCLDSQWFFWVIPLRKNIGKWCFIGIPYKKCNDPAGDYSRAGGQTKYIIWCHDCYQQFPCQFSSAFSRFF